MTTFLALYRGDTVASAKLVAVSADSALVREFAARLLNQPPEPEDDDPVLDTISRARKRALRLIAREEGPPTR